MSREWSPVLAGALLAALCPGLAAQAAAVSEGVQPVPVLEAAGKARAAKPMAKNLIIFLGDGMSLATVAATRAFSVGIDGKLYMDQLPFTALSRTASADHITTDSAASMSQIVTGRPCNTGVISMDAATELLDFNKDGDGAPAATILELAKAAGKSIGVVTTTRVTHATPAACFAHINDRDAENAIALQSLPTDPTYDRALGTGLDLIVGGGRRFFLPKETIDEEGDKGARTDKRDLRVEFQAAGYKYVWNRGQWTALRAQDLPVLALFESSHMEYEWDRPYDVGREPSLAEMTAKAVELLGRNKNGFVLMVEGGRIDHAHHECNAWRVLTDTEIFDDAIGAAIAACDLRKTMMLVTSDHGHVFNVGGYPLRPFNELPYKVPGMVPAGYAKAPFSGILGVVFDLDEKAWGIGETLDRNKTPYTVLSYGNGPGYRSQPRVDPRTDATPGYLGLIPSGPTDPAYLFEAAVPLSGDTHSGEDQGVWAIGAGSSMVRGTVPSTQLFFWMKEALGL